MKNGFVNAPRGTVVIWTKSDLCPVGFVRAIEMPDATFVRFHSVRNFIPTSNRVNSHTTQSHQHTSAHTHDGSLPYNGVASYDGVVNDGVMENRWPSSYYHTHTGTLPSATATLVNSTGSTDNTYTDPSYRDVLHCRRI